MLDPTLPAQMSAVIKGASDRTSATVIKEGSQELAPKAASDGLYFRFLTFAGEACPRGGFTFVIE